MKKLDKMCRSKDLLMVARGKVNDYLGKEVLP